MKNFFKSTTFLVGLAIFSMFFGAGNLILPLQAGLNSGTTLFWGMTGFMLTAVLIPLLGLVSMILFNGDYKEFFYRLGALPGFFLIFTCMFILGPCIAMARNVTLSYEMLLPFMKSFEATTGISCPELPLFSIIFCLFTFIATYKESRILSILGKWISPILLGSLGIIIIKGILNPHPCAPSTESAWNIFREQMEYGYASLDLIGALFFACAVLTILRRNTSEDKDYNLRTLVYAAMKGGFLSCALLGIIYYGLLLVGAYYGPLVQPITNPAELFSQISFAILGQSGAFIIALTVVMACYSTIMALAMVLAEYINREVTLGFVSYISSLVIVLAATAAASCYGLSKIMALSSPIINTIYPVLIVLTILNIAYKMFGFSYVKLPTLIAFGISIYYNLDHFRAAFLA